MCVCVLYVVVRLEGGGTARVHALTCCTRLTSWSSSPDGWTGLMMRPLSLPSPPLYWMQAPVMIDLVNAFVPTFADVALPVGAFVTGAVLPTIINIKRITNLSCRIFYDNRILAFLFVLCRGHRCCWYRSFQCNFRKYSRFLRIDDWTRLRCCGACALVPPLGSFRSVAVRPA